MKENMRWKPVLLPVGLCIKDGMIWFVQGCGNQMMGMDALSFQIKKRLRIPCTPWEKDFFHRGLNDKVVDIGNRLLILLNGSDVIYAYDFSFGEIDKVTSLPDGRTFLNNAVLFQDGILFLLPYHGSCLLKYDVYNDCWEEIQVTNRNICMEQPFEIENDVIVAVDGHSNVVCRYHLWENRMEEISVGDRDNHYWGIIRAGEYYVLPHHDKKAVTLWKRETGEVYEIADFPEDFGGVEGYCYLSMHKEGKDVLLVPYYANMVLKIDVVNRRISNAFPEKKFWLSDSSGDKISDSKVVYYASVQQNKKIYLYSIGQGNWHIADMDEMSLKFLPKQEMNGEDRAYIGRLFDDSGKEYFYGHESKISCCSLDNFILSVIDCTEIDRETEACSSVEIWNTLQERV